MKFALLIASVSAVLLQKDAQTPDSGVDTTHQYSIKVNDNHNAIQARSDADVAARNAALAAQAKADAWRAKFNPDA